jgi:hypothetical protein
MRKQLYTVLATIISAIVLISCQPNSVSPQVGENGDIQDIRCFLQVKKCPIYYRKGAHLEKRKIKIII